MTSQWCRSQAALAKQAAASAGSSEPRSGQQAQHRSRADMQRLSLMSQAARRILQSSSSEVDPAEAAQHDQQPAQTNPDPPEISLPADDPVERPKGPAFISNSLVHHSPAHAGTDAQVRQSSQHATANEIQQRPEQMQTDEPTPVEKPLVPDSQPSSGGDDSQTSNKPPSKQLPPALQPEDPAGLPVSGDTKESSPLPEFPTSASPSAASKRPSAQAPSAHLSPNTVVPSQEPAQQPAPTPQPSTGSSSWIISICGSDSSPQPAKLAVAPTPVSKPRAMSQRSLFPASQPQAPGVHVQQDQQQPSADQETHVARELVVNRQYDSAENVQALEAGHVRSVGHAEKGWQHAGAAGTRDDTAVINQPGVHQIDTVVAAEHQDAIDIMTADGEHVDQQPAGQLPAHINQPLQQPPRHDGASPNASGSTLQPSNTEQDAAPMNDDAAGERAAPPNAFPASAAHQLPVQPEPPSLPPSRDAVDRPAMQAPNPSTLQASSGTTHQQQHTRSGSQLSNISMHPPAFSPSQQEALAEAARSAGPDR